MPMKLIVISHPGAVTNEAEHVQRFVNTGLETFHLRKPDSSQEEFEKTLRQTPAVYYRKMVIHNHYRLMVKYNIKGIHLTESFIKNTEPAELNQVILTAHKRKLTVSGSYHSVEALENMALKLDYVFLGPVYNSISKEGYLAKIDIEYASAFLQSRRSFEVIAIGGIDESNIRQVRNAGFDGAALLGSVWSDNDPCGKFKIIRKSLIA
jgi:thiamine-phosphate pyrophosphorylase